MTSLPASIEAYLQEAGFTATEILVLKKLLEGEAVTLRELATRTGKSTGVLDQATKKLLNRKIIAKQMINGTPKILLVSLQAILDWVREDSDRKHAVLHRKVQDFESFVQNVTQTSHRPEMEYFEGQEGIQAAYTKLLALSNKEMLHYVPANEKEEDDPLREFKVQYFRTRRSRKIFSRVIAPDTALGRRYQSRDVFEYRKTVLLPPDRFPAAFEKAIAGDVVACFNHEQQEACFIHYPELVESERRLFETLWCSSNAEAAEPEACPVAEAPLQTRFLSAFREFVLGPRSVAAIAICVVSAGIITYGLYQHNVRLNTERVREQIKGVAATAAQQFDAEDLDVLRTKEDASRPEYAKVIGILNEIRNSNPDIVYAYIVRPTGEAGVMSFIADADSLDLDAKKDLNGDGIVDSADWLSPPGELYEVTNEETYRTALVEATADVEPYTDQWGTFVAGFAPIKDAGGRTVAVVGFDRDAADVYRLTRQTFLPGVYFSGFFMLFLFLRFAAFNRSLLKEMLHIARSRYFLMFFFLCFCIALGITYALYRHNVALNRERVRERVTAIAATAAPEFANDALATLRTDADINSPAYDYILEKLNNVRSRNHDIIYVYILRPSTSEAPFEFVADADGIYLGQYKDTNRDGIYDEADTIGIPGMPYFTESDVLISGEYKKGANANKKPYSDKWGTFFTGYAPIWNAKNELVGILSVDMTINDLNQITADVFDPFIIFLIVFALILILGAIAFSFEKIRR